MKSTRTRRAALAAVATTGTVLAVMGAALPSGNPPDSAGDPWPGGTVRSVGKLVAELPGDRAESCSAAVVDSPSGSILATAAHCVRSPDRPQAPRALYFQPAYRDGGGPKSVVEHGWKVTDWRTSPRWNVTKPLATILPDDWAFLKVAKKGGRTIQQAYGANKIRFGPIGDGEATTLGYPATGSYDGERLDYCAGRAHVYRKGEIAAANVGALSLHPCRLTQGVSGGPWLRGWDARRRSATVVAVTSVGTDSELLGRPFPASARSVLRQLGG